MDLTVCVVATASRQRREQRHLRPHSGNAYATVRDAEADTRAYRRACIEVRPPTDRCIGDHERHWETGAGIREAYSRQPADCPTDRSAEQLDVPAGTTGRKTGGPQDPARHSPGGALKRSCQKALRSI